MSNTSHFFQHCENLFQVVCYRNEKLLAFRNYLESLDAAELSKRDALLRLAYTNLSVFYALIEDYDKAIDYNMKITVIDQENRNRYNLLGDYNNTGKLFSAKKQTDLVLSMYEKPIALADSMHYEKYKVNSYLDEGYGSIYTEMGKFDSAYFFLKRAEPEIEQKATPYADQNISCGDPFTSSSLAGA